MPVGRRGGEPPDGRHRTDGQISRRPASKRFRVVSSAVVYRRPSGSRPGRLSGARRRGSAPGGGPRGRGARGGGGAGGGGGGRGPGGGGGGTARPRLDGLVGGLVGSQLLDRGHV